MTTQELIAKSQADYANFVFDWYLMLGVMIILYVAAFIATVRILHRMGLSGWWSLLVVFFQPIGLAVVAYRRWPALEKIQIKGP